MRRALATAVLLLTIAGCGGDALPLSAPSGTGSASPSATATSATCTPGGAALSITAKERLFDVSCLAAPTNTAVVLTLENDDAGIQHSVSIYETDPSKDSGATTLFEGALVTGVATKTYNVPAIPAGTYFFRCEVHPSQMFGVYVVA